MCRTIALRVASLSAWALMVIVVLAVPARIYAADYCLAFADGGEQRIIQGIKFKLPRPGRCKSFLGFESARSLVWTGGACTGTSGFYTRIQMHSEHSKVAHSLQAVVFPPESPQFPGSVQEVRVNANTNEILGFSGALVNAYSCSGQPDF